MAWKHGKHLHKSIKHDCPLTFGGLHVVLPVVAAPWGVVGDCRTCKEEPDSLPQANMDHSSEIVPVVYLLT